MYNERKNDINLATNSHYWHWITDAITFAITININITISISISMRFDRTVSSQIGCPEGNNRILMGATVIAIWSQGQAQMRLLGLSALGFAFGGSKVYTWSVTIDSSESAKANGCGFASCCGGRMIEVRWSRVEDGDTTRKCDRAKHRGYAERYLTLCAASNIRDQPNESWIKSIPNKAIRNYTTTWRLGCELVELRLLLICFNAIRFSTLLNMLPAR